MPSAVRRGTHVIGTTSGKGCVGMAGRLSDSAAGTDAGGAGGRLAAPGGTGGTYGLGVRPARCETAADDSGGAGRG